jgi:hypothetical protein
VKVTECGRLLFPAESEPARRYAERNLTTLYARGRRVAATLRRDRIGGVEREASAAQPPLPDEVLNVLKIDPGQHWLLLRDYDDIARERSILFLFRDGRPSAVVKVRPKGSEGNSLHREAAVLTLLRERADPEIVRTVPEVLQIASTESHESVVVGALPGRPLTRLMQESVRGSVAHGEKLSALGGWLGTMQRQTRGEDGFPVSHGDFWPRNVLFEGDRITGVVDWEGASESGSPFADLFTMAILFYQTPPMWAAESNRELERAFRGSRALSRYFDQWCTAAGVGRAVLRTAFEQFVTAESQRTGKEKNRWQGTVPWDLLRTIAAGRSVFSG